MPVIGLNRKAGFCNRGFDAGSDDSGIGLIREQNPVPQLSEKSVPEGELLVDVHPLRQTDGGLALDVRVVPAEDPFSAVREQVFDDRLSLARLLAAEFVRALVAPVGLLALDREFLHVAEVRAGLAGELPQGVVHIFQTEPAEIGGLVHRGALLPGQQGRPHGADHPVVGRNDDLLFEHRGKGAGHGPVVRGAALEKYDLADLSSPHHPVQIVIRDRIGQPRGQVLLFRPSLLMGGDVLPHEYGAPLPEFDRHL